MADFGFMNTDSPWGGGGADYSYGGGGGDIGSSFYDPNYNWDFLTSPTNTDFGIGSVMYDPTGLGGDLGYLPQDYYDPTYVGYPQQSGFMQDPWSVGSSGDYSGGLLSSIGDVLKGTSLKDWMTLGGGALSLVGALQKRNEERRLADIEKKLYEEKIKASQTERVLEPDKFALPAALDFAKSNYIIDRLVAGGKMSPEQAQLMKAQYRAANEQTLSQPQYHVSNVFSVNPFAPPKVAPINGMARGGLSLVQYGGGGQADDVDARLSSGEYVMDADTVSALGDGDTMTGARRLDEMRENVRRHKRSASPKKIPPKAKKPEGYMGKGR